jgi:hypothetical protein
MFIFTGHRPTTNSLLNTNMNKCKFEWNLFSQLGTAGRTSIHAYELQKSLFLIHVGFKMCKALIASKSVSFIVAISSYMYTHAHERAHTHTYTECKKSKVVPVLR